MLPARPIALIVTLLLPVSAWAAPRSDAAHYRICLGNASANPAGALADATGWVKTGGGVAAEHCAAVALVGLKRYAEAGAKLDAAAAARDVPSTAFRSTLFNQAGNAWLLAGDSAKAVSSFSAALALSGGDADLYADLARAQAMRKNWHEVELDLNAALQTGARRSDLLVLRASARRALGRMREAADDIEAALKISPDNSDALVERGLLRRQVGDVGGARRDFEAVVKRAPNGEAAATARENLEVLGQP